MRRMVYMSLKYDMSSSRFVVASVGIGRDTGKRGKLQARTQNHKIRYKMYYDRIMYSSVAVAIYWYEDDTPNSSMVSVSKACTHHSHPTQQQLHDPISVQRNDKSYR